MNKTLSQKVKFQNSFKFGHSVHSAYCIDKENQVVYRKVKLFLNSNCHCLNPFRTVKATTNDNHRLCLKWKPQIKYH